MPELPEVETIVKALRLGGRGGEALPGRKVSAVDVLWHRTAATPTGDVWLRMLAGQQLLDVTRRGKFVVMPFERDTLLIHLRMSGDLRVEPTTADIKPHDRLLITFTTGVRLAFNDPRKFGRAWLTPTPNDVLGGLGVEPLSDAFTTDWLSNALASHRRQLKPLLLDQSFIAGLGNIYSDESLHLSGLHPLRIASSLTSGEVDRLHSAIQSVLNQGIRHNGASLDWVYRGGDFQNYFRVYGRAGQPCQTCGTPIVRLVVGQRGTHICPHCQPLPE